MKNNFIVEINMGLEIIKHKIIFRKAKYMSEGLQSNRNNSDVKCFRLVLVL
jgi:hypothetical protein